MTLQINSKDDIVGIPVLTVRKLLRRCGEGFQREWIEERVASNRLSSRYAPMLLDELVRLSFIKLKKDEARYYF